MSKRTSEQEIQSELRELTQRVRTLRHELEEMTARGRGRAAERPNPDLPRRKRPRERERTR